MSTQEENIARFEKEFAPTIDGWDWNLFDSVEIVVDALIDGKFTLKLGSDLEEIVQLLSKEIEGAGASLEEGLEGVLDAIMTLASGNSAKIAEQLLRDDYPAAPKGLSSSEIAEAFSDNYYQAGLSLKAATE